MRHELLIVLLDPIFDEVLIRKTPGVAFFPPPSRRGPSQHASQHASQRNLARGGRWARPAGTTTRWHDSPLWVWRCALPILGAILSSVANVSASEAARKCPEAEAAAGTAAQFECVALNVHPVSVSGHGLTLSLVCWVMQERRQESIKGDIGPQSAHRGRN